MKHLSIAVIGLSVAVVAAAAIAQTKPPEGPATSSASRKQSGTVGASPDAAPVVNPQAASQAEPAAVAPSAATSSPDEGALAPAARTPTHQPRLAKRPDRN